MNSIFFYFIRFREIELNFQIHGSLKLFNFTHFHTQDDAHNKDSSTSIQYIFHFVSTLYLYACVYPSRCKHLFKDVLFISRRCVYIRPIWKLGFYLDSEKKWIRNFEIKWKLILILLTVFCVKLFFSSLFQCLLWRTYFSLACNIQTCTHIKRQTRK